MPHGITGGWRPSPFHRWSQWSSTFAATVLRTLEPTGRCLIPAHAGLLLPPGSRLLHIGPHKTGTTSIQDAFHRARAVARAQGVHYAGRKTQPMAAAYDVIGVTPSYLQGLTRSHWAELVADIRSAGGRRVVISSEGFCDADASAVGRIARDLDPERVHVVITLRPLASILPSQWQQFVQGGLQLPYEGWLDAMLSKPPGRVSPMFWTRHRHDELVRRWADVFGPSHVTVVVADDRDHGVVLRVFEQLSGLREGTLKVERKRTNRSLTAAEIELVRTMNRAFAAEGWSPQFHSAVLRSGAAELLKGRVPAPGERRIETPAWAVARAIELGQEFVSGIAASGVRVVGDLQRLAQPPNDARADAVDDARRASDGPIVAAVGAMSVLSAAGLERVPDRRQGWSWPDAGVGFDGHRAAAVSTRAYGDGAADWAGVPLFRVWRVLRGRLRATLTGRRRAISD